MKVDKATEENIIGKFEETQSVKTVAGTYGVSETTVRNILDRNGVERNKRTKKVFRVCPECGRTATAEDAEYCCYCGSELRTEKEIAFDRFEKAIKSANNSELSEMWERVKGYVNE